MVLSPFRIGVLSTLFLGLVATAVAEEPMTRPTLGVRDEAIYTALGRPITFEFRDQALSEVISFFRDYADMNIVLDPVGLDRAGVDSTLPITAQVKDVPMREAIDLLLEPLELTTLVRDNVLVVTHIDEARVHSVTRVYPVIDLVQVRDVDGTIIWTDEQLMHSIVGTIDPVTWEEDGGDGRIAFYANTGSLIVTQSERVHIEVARLLSLLREARQSMESHAAAREQPDGATIESAVASRYRTKSTVTPTVETPKPADIRKAEADARLAEAQAEKAEFELNLLRQKQTELVNGQADRSRAVENRSRSAEISPVDFDEEN